MKNLSPSEQLREQYLEICEQLLARSKDMRNYAMKPGNAWLARAELAQIISLTGDLEQLLDQIKAADIAE